MGVGASWLQSPSGRGLCSQGWSLGKKDPGGVAPSRRCWLRGPRAAPVEEQMPSPCTPRLGPPFSSPPCPTSRITLSDSLGSASTNPCNHQASVRVSAFAKVQGPRLLNCLPHFSPQCLTGWFHKLFCYRRFLQRKHSQPRWLHFLLQR